jgi:D-alanyl-D-alanine carboxypeptidase/D-alanyl-D-alanine-endopeptidase (penicillin-binding protein 4)
MKLLFIVLLQISTITQKPDSLQEKWKARIIQKIDSLTSSPFLENGFLGLSIKSTQTGKNLVAYQSKKSLAPASTLKLVASATALLTLGENYTYKTTLEYSGQITDSVLKGNIYIKGNGDPSLGSWRFKNQPDYKQLLDIWAQKVKALGIKTIQGRIFGDASFFNHNVIPNTWIWGDTGNYYGAGCYGLNLNENLYWATFIPKGYMEPAGFVKTAPDLPYYSKINKVLTDKAGTGDQVNIYATPYQDVLLMEGFVPMGKSFSVKGAIPDPAFFAAYALGKKIEELGIKIQEGPSSSLELEKRYLTHTKPNETLILHTQTSPTLRELAKECNFNSINLYAEAFLKTPSTVLNMGTSTADAVKALEQIWRSKGLNLNGLKIKDGSGLSPSNGISAEIMTDILSTMSSEKVFQAFYESIPIVGVSGTVANLGKKSKAVGNIRAKSGSIENVRAYSGYFTSSSGELFCFSMMLNKYDSTYGNATKELEKLMILMADLSK